MKTYTMTWKMYGKFGYKGYACCRERIWPFPLRLQSFATPLEIFLWLITEKAEDEIPFFGSAHKDFRLSRCGKLVARSATYQGV